MDGKLVEEFTGLNSSIMPEFLAVPNKALWLPSIVFVEGVSALSIYRNAHETAVYQNGLIVVYVKVILTLGCRFHMNEYPFDEHECPICLLDVSRSASIYPSVLPWDSGLNKDFGVSGEWDLVNLTKKTSMKGRQACPSFVLHLRRKTTFYSVVMLFPMVLTSYLNVLVFLLPPDLGDKASYLVTLTVSMSVYVAFFNTDMPRGLDSMPRVFVLLIFVYAESFCILLMCLFVSKKYSEETGHQETEPAITSSPLKKSKNHFSNEKDDMKSVAGRIAINMSAKRLDSVFFVLAFVTNSVGLATILNRA